MSRTDADRSERQVLKTRIARRRRRDFAPKLEAMEERSLLSGTITEFSAPSAAALPLGITNGPDGNPWFTESRSGDIGTVGTNGLAEFQLPASRSPYGITTGPDGNLWFTETLGTTGGAIGVMSPGGHLLKEFPLSGSNVSPHGITTGPDGALWFTEAGAARIGRITTSGATTTYPVSSGSRPESIVLGSDGNLWFTEAGTDRIGRISSAGGVAEFSLPVSITHPIPWGITAGPDGALWFTEAGGNQIGRIDTTGVVSEFPLPTPQSRPIGIGSGQDGTLFFTEYGGDALGEMTTDGYVSETALPSSQTGASALAITSDGGVWLTEARIGRIASLPYAQQPSASPNNAQAVSTQVAATGDVLALADPAAQGLGHLRINGTPMVETEDNYQTFIKYLTVPPAKQNDNVFKTGTMAQIKAAGLEDPLRRLIFDRMNNNGINLFVFKNLTAAQENFQMRINIIAFMNAIRDGKDANNSKVDFGYFSYGGTATQADSTNWVQDVPATIAADKVAEYKKTRFVFRTVKGVDADTAIKGIVSSAFRGECLGAMQITVLYAAEQVIGKARFNKIHPNGLVVGMANPDFGLHVYPIVKPGVQGKIAQAVAPAAGDTTITVTGFSIRPQLGSTFTIQGSTRAYKVKGYQLNKDKSLTLTLDTPLAAADGIPAPGANVVLKNNGRGTLYANITVADMVPGDSVYMKNKDDYNSNLKPGVNRGFWTGENAFYMGDYGTAADPTVAPRFSGMGMYDKTESEFRDLLVTNYNAQIPNRTDSPAKAVPADMQWTNINRPVTGD